MANEMRIELIRPAHSSGVRVLDCAHIGRTPDDARSARGVAESFVFFKDPDGNGWALQAMTPREDPA
jgi:hypothetical protein